MKNDMKKKDGKVEDKPNKPAQDQEEAPVAQSVQTDDLKKELSQVLKEMRKYEEESRLCKV